MKSCWPNIFKHLLLLILSIHLYLTFLISGSLSFIYYDDNNIINATYNFIAASTTISFGDIAYYSNISKITTIIAITINTIAFNPFLGYTLTTFLRICEDNLYIKLNIRNKSPILSLSFLSLLTVFTQGHVLIFFLLAENWSLFDALYFILTTLTSVGYGNIIPATILGKITSIFQMIFCCIIKSAFVGIIINIIISKHKDILTNKILNTTLNRKFIQKFDLNNDKSVTLHEYMTYVLLTTGKVDQSWINNVTKKFKNLDKNDDNILDEQDIHIIH